MRELPPTSFLRKVSYTRLKVNRDWHITCNYQYYSRPSQRVGESVIVRLTPDLVSIVNEDQHVTEYTRFHGFKYGYSTGPSYRGPILDVFIFRGPGPEDLPKIIFDRDG